MKCLKKYFNVPKYLIILNLNFSTSNLDQVINHFYFVFVNSSFNL